MVIYLSGSKKSNGPVEGELTPRRIVEELDKYVIGQEKAKKSVAIALRNRMRRLKLQPEMAEEVIPKNIIMIGATGVGKTEIARRLARLTHSPFLKVEATKFTEIGYVGRDAESMVRDLTELAISMVKDEMTKEVRKKAERNAQDKLVEILTRKEIEDASPDPEAPKESKHAVRDRVQEKLQQGHLEDVLIEIEVSQKITSSMQVFTAGGIEEMDLNLRDMMPGLFGGGPKSKRVSVAEARDHFTREEEQKLIDMDRVTSEAIIRVEQAGIIFIDEIDKIAGRESRHGPDVSREGVQRDILPIVEGTSVTTKYGVVKTDHILFISSGAFHMSKPSDLIPELQGRFPIRVELDMLGKEEFKRILVEPKGSLTEQYIALMGTEDIDLEFTEDAIDLIAEYAAIANEKMENIGARRLQTIMEKVLEDISFLGGELPDPHAIVDAEYVKKQLEEVIKDYDLSRYIL
ncbi:ATP-dependent protease ATPase subunit HslU [Acidobacteriota bacterium]